MDINNLKDILTQSVNHVQAKQAEQLLKSAEKQNGFCILLLHIAADNSCPMETRLAAAVFFKNFIRRNWTDVDGNYKIPLTEVQALKSEIIKMMTQLPPALQIQIGDAVSIMADSDFPDRWQNLIPELVSRLGENSEINGGVLTVAHSIFRRWRPLFRSDDLFREIKLVLDQFTQPYLEFFVKTDADIQNASNDRALLNAYFVNFNILIKIYFDLNCQDIPEFFEDHLEQFMEVFHKYLTYQNPLLESDDDEVGILEKVKSGICEILELYTHRYEDIFQKLLPTFVETTWHLLTTTGLQPKNDILVSKALSFLTSVTKIQRHSQMFSSEETLAQVLQNVVVPNMTLRTSDEELFEDDPIEYIRRDLEGSDSDTRRRAATDFLRELTEKFEGKVTQVVMTYIKGFLDTYNLSKHQNWRAKDTAIYLFSSIAAKGNMTHAGVSSTNLLVDVVKFFMENIAPDLLSTDISPILKVDAIKFIYMFRNQLTKEQLVDVFPLLSQHLLTNEYVVYTYSAITIEKLLCLRKNNVFMFQNADIAPIGQELVTNIMQLILKGNSSPEKLAENEFLMKCIMRILITVEKSVTPYASTLLGQLVDIVVLISKNPSNPKFTHYTFESIGAIIRFAGASLGYQQVEGIVLNKFLGILGGDVPEFAPYIIQILAQMLASRHESDGLGPFEALVRPLLSPSLWEAKGNAPALVQMLQSILTHGSLYIVQNNLTESLLGVFQNLIASKVNGEHGLALLEDILIYIPFDSMKPYLTQIAFLLLQRLQVAKTDKYVARLSQLIYFLAANNQNPNLGPIFAVDFIDAAQNDVFGRIFEAFILPSTNHISGLLERKIAVVGLSRLILENTKFINGPYTTQWIPAIETLIKLIQSPLAERQTDSAALSNSLDDLVFGASYAQLSTSSVQRYDPAPEIQDTKVFFIDALKKANIKNNDRIYELISNLCENTKKYLSEAGIGA